MFCQKIERKSFKNVFSVNHICRRCFEIDYFYIGYTKIYFIYAKNELDLICLVSTILYHKGVVMNTLFTFVDDFLNNRQIFSYLDFDTEKLFIVGDYYLQCQNMSSKNY